MLVSDTRAVVRSEVTDRTMAISPDQARRIPRVIAVAGGDQGHTVTATGRPD